MNIFEFMDKNPILTFLIALILCEMIVQIFKIFKKK